MSNRWIVAIMILVVAIGTLVFHLVSPWWATPIASNWTLVDDTITITFWITGVVFIAILLFMAYCVYKFSYREGHRATYNPENKKLEWWLTIGTAVGVAGLLAPGLIAWNDFVTVPDEASEIEVIGKQWEWTYRYPGKDGVLGTTNVKFYSDDNPFSLDPDDPNGRDDILVDGDDLHLPIGKPTKVLLRAVDVLHDFYVPQFRAKMDMVPGAITFFWVTPTRTGTFDVLCFELCGVGHHAMRSQVVVEDASAYDTWLGEQETFAQTLAAAAAGTKTASNPVASKAEAVPAESGSGQ